MIEDKDKAKTRDALIGQLPLKSPIYLPTSKISLDDQIRGLIKVKTLYEGALETEYKEKLQNLKKGLKNKKRCFLIGNGPSLNDTDLSLLEGETTFAVNGFFLKSESLNWKPTFYVVEDHLVAEDRADELTSFKGPIKFYPAYLGYCLKASEDVIFYNHRPRISYPDGFDFSLKADEITYTGCTVMFSALQIAAYLGFEEIYLIGVDASYDMPKTVARSEDYGVSILDMPEDDPNHFDPNYFGKGYRWHDPQVEKMVEAFSEARKVCDANNISIRNATVGGQLEVFERVEYNSLFSEKITSVVKNPKLLLIDFTRIGGRTATGELKAKFLHDWPARNLLHIYAEGGSNYGLHINGTDTYSRAIGSEIITVVEKFEPDTIIYRPVGDREDFHMLAMDIISQTKKPFIIWLMDDWPARLMRSDPDKGKVVDLQLQELCQKATQCWAISPAMAGAFGARYGSVFDVYHNGIDPLEWQIQQGRKRKAGPIRLRYIGGAAPDMTARAIEDVVAAVDVISQDVDIVFEIKTQSHWFESLKKRVQYSSNTHVSLSDLNENAYKSWLSEADILLICANFDEKSRIYTQYSLANKMPEYLASGCQILAYGPNGLSTLDSLVNLSGVTRVNVQNVKRLSDDLRNLIKVKDQWSRTGNENKKHAFERYNFVSFKRNFYKDLVNASGSNYSELDQDILKTRSISIWKKFKSNTLLYFFVKYVISWKGVVGLFSGLLMSIGVFILITSPISYSTIFGLGCIFAAQMVLLGLIAHLSAHVNKNTYK